LSIGSSPGGSDGPALRKRKKKADVAELVFGHVGLLINEPPGSGRVALLLVIRHMYCTPLSRGSNSIVSPRFGIMNPWVAIASAAAFEVR
jgi:hypothetical protein